MTSRKPQARKTAARKPAAPAAAKRAEATERPNAFWHDGIEYVIPIPQDMPVGLLDVEDEIEAIKLILGDQWDVYKASGATIREFEVFVEKVLEAAGFGSSGN
ncbi:hypothetical protein CTZ27_03150 [Streptomyces griseocarneus]|nr:hypothetical protein CTZ27_03150 [Streptomyces griseocarneus]